MADYPIIFSGPMVRALLDGRKTQTRRLAWRECRCCFGGGRVYAGPCGLCGGSGQQATLWQKVKPSDRLWVRETWRAHVKWDNLPPRDLRREKASRHIDYKVASMFNWPPDRSEHAWGKVRQSIYMPRWASRLTLIVTETRIERVREISWDDAIAEGMGIFPHSMSSQKRFSEVWNSLHGPDAWTRNDEVVALTFEVREGNIDQEDLDRIVETRSAALRRLAER